MRYNGARLEHVNYEYTQYYYMFLSIQEEQHFSLSTSVAFYKNNSVVVSNHYKAILN